MKQNVLLVDNNPEDSIDFLKGLQSSTNLEWRILSCVSNYGRTGLNNAFRYIKYFYFPFVVFLKREKYDCIVGWQAFYALLFTFYCIIFRTKKKNFIVVVNFLYRKKHGSIGLLYDKFVKFIVNSQYVDLFICNSDNYRQQLSEYFNIPIKKIISHPFGVSDEYSKFTKYINNEKTNYALSLGRSNRDWDFLIDSFSKSDHELIIICDELKRKHLPSNITVLNNIWGIETYKYISNAQCMIIPVLDGKIPSGDTVLMRAMSFYIPVIITKPSRLAEDFIVDNVTGLIVNKNIDELNEAVNIIFNDKLIHKKLSTNARKVYEDKYSLIQYGANVGNDILNFSSQFI